MLLEHVMSFFLQKRGKKLEPAYPSAGNEGCDSQALVSVRLLGRFRALSTKEPFGEE